MLYARALVPVRRVRDGLHSLEGDIVPQKVKPQLLDTAGVLLLLRLNLFSLF